MCQERRLLTRAVRGPRRSGGTRVGRPGCEDLPKLLRSRLQNQGCEDEETARVVSRPEDFRLPLPARQTQQTHHEEKLERPNPQKTPPWHRHHQQTVPPSPVLL